MTLVFLNKSVQGCVETVELEGFPGVHAQVAKGEVTCLTFDDQWTEQSASVVIKTFLGVDSPVFEQKDEEAQAPLALDVHTLSKNEDQMIQTAWGYVSRAKGNDELSPDVSGDTMTVEELTKGVHYYVKNSGRVKDNHSDKVVGHIVEAMVFDNETRRAVLGLEKTEPVPDGHDGVLLRIQYTDREHWNTEIRSGKKLALSLGGRAKRSAL